VNFLSLVWKIFSGFGLFVCARLRCFVVVIVCFGSVLLVKSHAHQVFWNSTPNRAQRVIESLVGTVEEENSVRISEDQKLGHTDTAVSDESSLALSFSGIDSHGNAQIFHSVLGIESERQRELDRMSLVLILMRIERERETEEINSRRHLTLGLCPFRGDTLLGDTNDTHKLTEIDREKQRDRERDWLDSIRRRDRKNGVYATRIAVRGARRHVQRAVLKGRLR